MSNPECLSVGPWSFEAHVETRSSIRYDDKSLPLGPGDVLYRFVLEVSYDISVGGSDLAGLCGELSTCWQFSLEDAREEAATLVSMMVRWEEYDEPKNEYVVVEGTAELTKLIDEAVARFELVTRDRSAS